MLGIGPSVPSDVVGIGKPDEDVLPVGEFSSVVIILDEVSEVLGSGWAVVSTDVLGVGIGSSLVSSEAVGRGLVSIKVGNSKVVVGRGSLIVDKPVLLLTGSWLEVGKTSVIIVVREGLGTSVDSMSDEEDSASLVE